MKTTPNFDDSLAARQRRMGLRHPDGTLHEENISVLAGVYAGIFYDEMCDYYPDPDRATVIFREIAALDAEGAYQRLLCTISYEFDRIRSALSPHFLRFVCKKELIEPFARAFAAHLQEIRSESEVV